MTTALDELRFVNRFTTELPADPSCSPERRIVTGAAFSRVRPTPVARPRLLAWSADVAQLLGIAAAVEADPQRWAEVLAGNEVPAGADPFAMCYGGHQFGSWAGQLGDGRAIALGEVVDRAGGHQTLQLKGAGPTPYSRGADGRAVLRSSIREFLCSEAMHHLGIATTRALSLVATGEDVVRDVLYDGHPRPEPGAVVCRVAPSFTRFGTFELPASRGDVDLLAALVRFTLRADFPELQRVGPDGTRELSFDEQVVALLAEVVRRTAALVVDWMRVGFVHGVLNTDNLSITGATIDYGPYGWLEDFDPEWTPNTTDAGTLRYRYGAQPQIAHWNLWQLANALAPLVDDPSPLQGALDAFVPAYDDGFHTMTVRRLGWDRPAEGDVARIEALFAALRSGEIDQALFFRDLARVPLDPDALRSDDELLEPIAAAWYQPEQLHGPSGATMAAWLRSWAQRVRAGGCADAERVRAMDAVNPRYVLRNYLAQEVIDAAEAGDLGPLHELQEVLRRPYQEQPGRERFARRRPEWARHRVGCSMLSCSS